MGATSRRGDWRERQRELDAARVRYATVLAEMDRIEEARRTTSSAPARRTTTMELGRNREGVLYVRQPMGESGRERIVTWHIDARGEADLRARGIGVGSPLPSGLLAQLRAEGKLYTGTSPAKAPATAPARATRRSGWTWSRWHDDRPA